MIDESIIIRFEKVMELLMAGKKVFPVTGLSFSLPSTVQLKASLQDGRVLYSEDNKLFPKMTFELYHGCRVDLIEVSSHGSGPCHKIEYVYANGGFNSIFAKLEGIEESVHYPFGLMDFYWRKWEEYKPEMRVGLKANIYSCSECDGDHIDINAAIIKGEIQTSCPKTSKLIVLKK